jgi:uncharacterized protein YbjT (DUF2867 family)
VEDEVVLIAGATGMLGSKITKELIKRDPGAVRAIVRPGSNTEPLRDFDVELVEGDLLEPASLNEACNEVDVVVSAVRGGEPVEVEGQVNLLEVADEHDVERMIPSDYAVNIFNVDYGDNPNVDNRKQVAEAFENTNVAPTHVLNGGFMEITFSEHNPLIDQKAGEVTYWGDGDQPCDFTHTDDVAAYTAAAALDSDMANKRLHVAGDTLSMKQLRDVWADVTDRDITAESLGTVDELADWIEERKASGADPGSYLMHQYHYTMVSGKGKLPELNNDRYPEIEPVTLGEFI